MSASHDEPITLETLDRDGALRETAAEAAEAIRAEESRGTFLKKGAMFAGAGLAIGAFPLAGALAKGGGLPKGDIKILNYALTLEYLEAAFYAEAVSKGKLTGVTSTFASTVAQHEAAHVQALKSTLGSSAVKKPSFDFKGTTGSQKKFLATAKVLEDTGVSAYEGQAGNIKTPAVLMAAASILSVEARHAAWVRDIIGASGIKPAPDAFDAAKSMSDVLAAVKATGFIKG